MRTFHLDWLSSAFLCFLLAQTIFGVFVVLPVICINFTWNSIISTYTVLPQIAWWQATLLYMAIACVVYLSGLIRIEIKTEPDSAI